MRSGRTGGAERERLAEGRRGVPWDQWGPYLSQRQWGTVREDYSATGTAWDHFPHDHARSRAYRWGEDGLLGISDRDGYLCVALTLWNGADPILKERLFGLTGPEGNHGEDVKEYYFFLDATPTHAYMKALYKYPQRAYPYAELVGENRRRGRDQPEFELLDSGVFNGDRYFDVIVEYAKADPTDIVVKISAANRGPEPAMLHLLPTLWFRSTWAWGTDDRRPLLEAAHPDRPSGGAGDGVGWIRATHHALGDYWLACEGAPSVLFTENETNAERLWGVANRSPLMQGWDQRLRRARAAGRRQPGRPRHEGRGVVCPVCGGADDECGNAASRDPSPRRSLQGRGIRPGPAPTGSRRVP